MPRLDLFTLTAGVVTIDIGPDEVPFDVHIELICSLSPFFDRALNGRFQEADNLSVKLPVEEPETFAEFVAWLYSGVCFGERSASKLEWIHLAKLWVLADRYRVNALQNTLSKKFREKYSSQSGGMVDLETVEYIYDNSLPGSTLRKIVLHIAAWTLSPKALEEEEEKMELPEEFLSELAEVKIMQEKKSWGTTTLPLLWDYGAYQVNDEARAEECRKYLIAQEDARAKQSTSSNSKSLSQANSRLLSGSPSNTQARDESGVVSNSPSPNQNSPGNDTSSLHANSQGVPVPASSSSQQSQSPSTPSPRRIRTPHLRAAGRLRQAMPTAAVEDLTSTNSSPNGSSSSFSQAPLEHASGSGEEASSAQTSGQAPTTVMAPCGNETQTRAGTTTIAPNTVATAAAVAAVAAATAAVASTSAPPAATNARSKRSANSPELSPSRRPKPSRRWRLFKPVQYFSLLPFKLSSTPSSSSTTTNAPS